MVGDQAMAGGRPGFVSGAKNSLVGNSFHLPNFKPRKRTQNQAALLGVREPDRRFGRWCFRVSLLGANDQRDATQDRDRCRHEPDGQRLAEEDNSANGSEDRHTELYGCGVGRFQ